MDALELPAEAEDVDLLELLAEAEAVDFVLLADEEGADALDAAPEESDLG